MVAVGGLVLVNAVLLTLVVSRDPTTSAVPAPTAPRPTTSSSAARPVAPSPAPPSATPSASARATQPRPSAPPATNPREPSAAGPRLLAVSGPEVAWRAEPARCGDRSSVEVTQDGGRTWTRTRTGLSTVVRLRAYGQDAAFAVGADSRCRPAYAWTTAPDSPWRRDRDRLADKWFRTPARPEVVHAPGGRLSRPCGSGLRDLAGLATYSAAALCSDGRVRTLARGRGWRTVASGTSVVALNADDRSFVAAVSGSGCRTIVVRRFDTGGAALRSDRTCRGDDKGSDAPTAVSIRGNQTWVWSGKVTDRR